MCTAIFVGSISDSHTHNKTQLELPPIHNMYEKSSKVAVENLKKTFRIRDYWKQNTPERCTLLLFVSISLSTGSIRKPIDAVEDLPIQDASYEMFLVHISIVQLNFCFRSHLHVPSLLVKILNFYSLARKKYSLF